MKNKSPSLYIIAGPNGSGKTTFAEKFLPKYAKCPHFVNADLIALGLSPFSPEIAAIKAGRLVLKEINELLSSDKTFAAETTLSGRSYITFLKRAKKKNYKIHLFFLWITDPHLALERIRDRVAKGGHNIPSKDVKRRFSRSMNNFFKIYSQLVDSWYLFDNSFQEPNLIVYMRKDAMIVVEKIIYAKIMEDILKL